MDSPPPFPPPRACSSYTSRIAMFASLLPTQLRHSRSLCFPSRTIREAHIFGRLVQLSVGSKIPYCSNICSWPYIRSFVLSLFSTEKVSSGIEYPVHQHIRSYGYVRRIELGRMTDSISYFQQDSTLAPEWIYDHLKLRSFISTKGRFPR
jgi:hypothetical protein